MFYRIKELIDMWVICVNEDCFIYIFLGVVILLVINDKV